MAIVAIWGSSSANCYVELTAANSFITTGILDSAAWTLASTPMQIASLLQATREIDAKNYIGSQYTRDQALKFPRVGNQAWAWEFSAIAPESSLSLDQQRQKEKLEQATCQQALWLLQVGGRNVHMEARAQGIERWSESTGPVHESVTYVGGGATMIVLAPNALTLLREYLSSKRAYRA